MTALRWGSASDTGRVRSINQDAALVADPVFAVADGMGGHAAGEVASQVAVDALRDHVTPSTGGLVEAIRMANRQVLLRADGDPELRGMGTTMCAIALVRAPEAATAGDDGDRIIVANVGDSRVYLFHDDAILQISEDHSLVEDLVRQGRLSAEEARVHPQKNIVTRVLGNEADIEVDTWELIPYRGDRFLLCSDGLSNEVDDDTIADLLRRVDDPGQAAADLVRLANDNGGRDNITVVVVDVVDDGGRAAGASTALAADRSGLSSAGRRGGTGADALGNLPAGSTGRSTADAPAEPRARRVTFRSVLFVFALLAVLGLAGASIAYFSRTIHHVGVDDGQLAIYQGRPGGVLWIQPTLVERTGVGIDEVPPARRADVEDGKQEPSLEAARDYVANLQEQAEALRPSTTTTSSTSTTTPTTAPPPPTTAPA